MSTLLPPSRERGSPRVIGTPFRVRRADSALARYTPNSIKWLVHRPKVLASMAVGSKNVATGTYIGEVDRTYCLHPIGHSREAPIHFLDQRKVVAREVAQGVGNGPFPPGRVG